MSTVRELIEQEAYVTPWDRCPENYGHVGGSKYDCSGCREEALTRIAEAAAREGTRLGIAVTNSVSDPYMEVENIVDTVLGREVKP